MSLVINHCLAPVHEFSNRFDAARILKMSARPLSLHCLAVLIALAGMMAAPTEGYAAVYRGIATTGQDIVGPHQFSVDTNAYEFVYGGYAEDANVSKVTLNLLPGAEVTDSVFGAYALRGNARFNTINFSSNSLVYVESYAGAASNGDATNNTANVYGGFIPDLKGGQSAHGNATYNTVNVYAGEVHSIFGGNASSDTVTVNASYNKVNIYGGLINSIYGGYSISNYGSLNVNNSFYNTVTLFGTSASSIVGGASPRGYANHNTVILNGCDFINSNISGADALVVANNNRVSLYGSIVNGGAINGARTTSGVASNNTVNLHNVSLNNTELYGGRVSSSGTSVNNTLNMHASSGTLKSIAYFQNYNFNLGANQGNGSTVLTVSDDANVDNALVKLVAHKNTQWKVGDTITLIDASGATGTVSMSTANSTTESMQGFAKKLTFSLSTSGDMLQAKLIGSQVNEELKALSEGQIAYASIVRQGSDLIVSKGMTSAIEADLTPFLVPF